MSAPNSTEIRAGLVDDQRRAGVDRATAERRAEQAIRQAERAREMRERRPPRK